MDDDDTAYDGGKTLKSREEDDGRKDIEEQVSRKTLINQIDTKLKEYREISSPYIPTSFLPRFERDNQKYRKLIY